MYTRVCACVRFGLFVSIVPEDGFTQHVYSTVHKENKPSAGPRSQSGPMGKQVESFYALAT